MNVENPKESPFQFFGNVYIFSKNFSGAVEEITLTFWSPFAIFEPWIWRRIEPVPACYLNVSQTGPKCSTFETFLKSFNLRRQGAFFY